MIDGFLLSCRVEGKSSETVRYYEDNLGKFLWYVEQASLPLHAGEITAWHIREFLAYVKETPQRWDSIAINASKPVGLQHLLHYYACLRRFFHWLIEEGFIEQSPVDRIKPPKPPRKVIEPIEANEIEVILKTFDDKIFLGARNKAMILTFLDTGLRLRELASLRLHDVNLEAHCVTVRAGKGGHGRIVRIGFKTQKALWRWLLFREQLNGTDALWVSESGDAVQPNAISLVLRRIQRRTGIGCNPHRWRHTFSLHFLRNGGDPFTLQYLLGHSTLDMTKRYVATLGMREAFAAHAGASPADNINSSRRLGLNSSSGMSL